MRAREISKEKRYNVSTVKVRKSGKDMPPKHYTQSGTNRRNDYITWAIGVKGVSYVDISPREYTTCKLRYEARKGAYDYDRAMEVLSREDEPEQKTA